MDGILSIDGIAKDSWLCDARVAIYEILINIKAGNIILARYAAVTILLADNLGAIRAIICLEKTDPSPAIIRLREKTILIILLAKA